MKILVLGITGMLGNTIFRYLSNNDSMEVIGTSRRDNIQYFDSKLIPKILTNVNVDNFDSLTRVFSEIKPDVVINCIGLIKQLPEADNPLSAIPINSLFPHRLSFLCTEYGARLIHISTDCIFSGASGNYIEDDFPDAKDLYGRSKLLGEVYYPHTITLRTSIIGHELNSNQSLINWFLSQQGSTYGYTKAIFSGIPTVELAKIIQNIILVHPKLYGLYHVSASPTSKYDLLKLVAETYNKNIEIIPNDKIVINRSLNSQKFTNTTGYIAPTWPELIRAMHEFK